MSVGLVGTKIGMTRVFTEKGRSIPVTAILVDSNRITQIKTVGTDGYSALQITAGKKAPKRVKKPQAGHFTKAGVEAGSVLCEFRVSKEILAQFKAGDELQLNAFEVGQKLDVRGLSKGKGFAGAIKRHNFHMQDRTHGNSLSHRALGSVGQCQTPGRVFKGKKMAGQMGNVSCCIQNLEIVCVDVERNVLLIKGAVPGATGALIKMVRSVKQKNKRKRS